jgi:hypothetical protein
MHVIYQFLQVLIHTVLTVLVTLGLRIVPYAIYIFANI